MPEPFGHAPAVIGVQPHRRGAAQTTLSKAGLKGVGGTLVPKYLPDTSPRAAAAANAAGCRSAI
jgi:hypothetical protein